MRKYFYELADGSINYYQKLINGDIFSASDNKEETFSYIYKFDSLKYRFFLACANKITSVARNKNEGCFYEECEAFLNAVIKPA